MQITEALERRTIDYVMRNDNKGELVFVCCDGHEITLEIRDGEIEFKSQGIKIYLDPLSFSGDAATMK